MRIKITLKGIPNDIAVDELQKIAEKIKKDVADVEVPEKCVDCNFDKSCENEESGQPIFVLIKGDVEVYQMLDLNWESLVWVRIRELLWEEFPLATIKLFPQR
jgi:hypothetical protein